MMKIAIALFMTAGTLFAAATECRIPRERYETTLRSTVAFWTSPQVIDPAGGYHAWFDAEYRKIPPQPFRPSDSDAGRPLIVQLRILYAHAVAIAGSSDPAENTRLRRQYQHGRAYLAKYLDQPSGLLVTSLGEDGKPYDGSIRAITQFYDLYIMGEAALLAGDREAAKEALSLFRTLDQKAHDPVHGGYFETCIRTSGDTRNELKSVGTQIHAALGLAALYRATGDPLVKDRLTELVTLLTSGRMLYGNGNGAQYVAADFTIVPAPGKPPQSQVLYGHNAELVWYTLEAAEALGMDLKTLTPWAEKVAGAVLRNGVFPDGLTAIYGPVEGIAPRPDKSVWWIPLEVMNVSIRMYELTGKPEYLAGFKLVAGYGCDHFAAPNGLWANEIEFNPPARNAPFGGQGWKSGLHVIRSMRLILRTIDRIPPPQSP